jgi:transposase
VALGLVSLGPSGRVVKCPRTRPPYPPEFRAEAVRLAKSSGDPISTIAKDLGISDQTLRNWVNQDDVDTGRTSGLTSDERARLRELERENRKLREEREILRKAAAFFATESERR